MSDKRTGEKTNGKLSPPPLMENQEKQYPKDATFIISVLKEMGINDFEPRIVNQLLEFTYGYAKNVLKDAKAYADYANKEKIETDDVKLALQMMNKSYCAPLPQELIADLAVAKNDKTLPTIKPQNGVCLPYVGYCSNSQNYRLKKKPPTPPAKQRQIGQGTSQLRDDLTLARRQTTTSFDAVKKKQPASTLGISMVKYPSTKTTQYSMNKYSPNFTPGRPPIRCSIGKGLPKQYSSIPIRKAMIQINNPGSLGNELAIKIDLANENRFKMKQDTKNVSDSVRNEMTEDENLTDADRLRRVCESVDTVHDYSQKRKRKPRGSETETDSETEINVWD